MRKYLSTIFLPKVRKKAEAVSKTYELFVYGDVHYTTNSFCKKKVLIMATS